LRAIAVLDGGAQRFAQAPRAAAIRRLLQAERRRGVDGNAGTTRPATPLAIRMPAPTAS
jgi:hypothetical protein